MQVSPDYKLKEGDKIVHATVRDETPVINKKIEIVYQDENLIAVDKPASIPVHEGGNFKYNTILGILENEHKIKGLKTVHRLDKQTSGIVFFAKNDKLANEFREALTKDQVAKVYYARILGNFKERYGE
jgi:23S rRNA pseudouridine955/2504/2580 synthase